MLLRRQNSGSNSDFRGMPGSQQGCGVSRFGFAWHASGSSHRVTRSNMEQRGENAQMFKCPNRPNGQRDKWTERGQLSASDLRGRFLRHWIGRRMVATQL